MCALEEGVRETAQGVIVSEIDCAPVPPSESVTVSVMMLFPADSWRLKVRPVPMTPSRLLVQTRPASGRAPSSKSPVTGEGDHVRSGPRLAVARMIDSRDRRDRRDRDAAAAGEAL